MKDQLIELYIYARMHVYPLCVLLCPRHRGHRVCCFTMVHMTFHSIMQNVSYLIKPNYLWGSSLEARETTFKASNKFQSP